MSKQEVRPVTEIGCSAQLVIAGGTFGTLALIQAAFGIAASFWFGVGALVSTLFCLWEAGRNAQRDAALTSSAEGEG